MSAPAADRQAVHQALAAVTDPCMRAVGLEISVIDMGLINDISADDEAVEVKMTFTEVGCPFVMRLLDESERALQEAFPGRRVRIRPDWSPPWDPARLSLSAREMLAMSGAALRHLMPAAAAAESAHCAATESTEH